VYKDVFGGEQHKSQRPCGTPLKSVLKSGIQKQDLGLVQTDFLTDFGKTSFVSRPDCNFFLQDCLTECLDTSTDLMIV
jgi:hypothetical protein